MIPLQYNTCESLELTWGKLSSGVVREYADHINFYLNNYRNDSTAMVMDSIVIAGATEQPTYTMTKRNLTTATATTKWEEETGTFSLYVKHNGGVDLTVNCHGAATDRLTDVLNDTNLSIDLPKQPEDFIGEIIIEAEDMDFKNISSCVTDPYGWYPSVRGHAGNGFADMGTNTAGSLKHDINIKHPGDYKIVIRYTCTQRAGNLSVSVNGTKTSVACEKTATNEWKKATMTTSLKEGKNTLLINNTSGLKMYIDQVSYIPVETPEEQFEITIRETEHGTVSLNSETAVEGETVTLNVKPENGFELVGWNVIHGNVTINEDNTFIMPDDIVTIQPIFADMTSMYALDFTEVLGGNIPTGWRVTQENNDVHEYPNNFGSGSRTFAGFTGYQGKALYWRVGKAEYGRQSAYPLVLEPGNYKLTFAVAAWKESPKYKVSILDSKNATIAESPVYTATPNANGNSSANLSSAKTYELAFDVSEKGKHVICFSNNGTGFDEFLLLECRINTVIPEGIVQAVNDSMDDDLSQAKIYNTNGVQLPSLQKGMNIIAYPSGKIRKVIIK